MLIAILMFNGLLALMCFAIAAQMWQWRNALAQAADALQEADRVSYAVLQQAPTDIEAGQIASHRLRQSYRQLASQVQRVQQGLGIIGWSHQLILGKYPILKPHRRRPSS